MNKLGRYLAFAVILCVLFWRGLVVAAPLLEVYLRVQSPVAAADALVLMAGSPNERLPAVARLYKEGVAPRILLTNDGVRSAFSFDHMRNLYQVEWEELDLMKRGVPQEAIVKLDFTVSGTIHDALNTRAFVLADGGIRSLAVVTSDFHTRRTLWAFRKVFAHDPVQIAIYPVETDAAGGRGIGVLAMELAKFSIYWVRYGLVGFSGS